MGTRYVIAVMKVEDVEGGQYATRDTTLFEATHTDPARLARFAPEEVLSVLAGEAGVELTVPAVGLLPSSAWWRDGDTASMDRGFSSPGPDATTMEQEAVEVPATTEDAPKRKRRTKVEIAADKAAQAAGFRDAAHQAAEQRLNGEPEPLGVPEQVAESVEQHAAAAAVFGATPLPVAPAQSSSQTNAPAMAAPAPAAVYDPFA